MAEVARELLGWLLRQVTPKRLAGTVCIGAVAFALIGWQFGTDLIRVAAQLRLPEKALWGGLAVVCLAIGFLLTDVLAWGSGMLRAGCAAGGRLMRRRYSEYVAEARRKRAERARVRGILTALSPDARAFLGLFECDGAGLAQMSKQLLSYSIYSAGYQLTQQGVLLRSSVPQKPSHESFGFAPLANRMLRKLVFHGTPVNSQITLDLSRVAASGARGSGCHSS
jgi:hypothetical protein